MKKGLLFSFLLCLFAGMSMAQTRKISGQVLNQTSNEAMSSASITLKGTSTGVAADAEGKFSISVPEKGTAILIVKSVGFTSQEVDVTNLSNVVIKLSAESSVMEDVVVVGYGERKKKDVTGAVSQLQSKDITRANPVMAAKAIQGQVAGATVTKASNRPGAPFSITIRGENTVNNSTQPLYVIDGLMGGDINTLNPNDILSIDVLKDASSTAIYGARGANGVVIVTTKRGVSGKPRINYDGYVGYKQLAHVPRMRSTEEFYKLNFTDRKAAGLSPVVFTIAEQANIDAGITTDWVDLITDPGLQTSHTISVSGGSDKTTYRFSGGYLNEEGNVRYTGFKRYNVNAGLDAKLSDRVKAGFTSYLTYSDQEWGSQESLRNAFRARPTGTVFYKDITNPSQNSEIDVDGYAFWMGINDKQVGNPILDILPENSRLLATTSTMMANAYLDIELLKGLSFRSSISASQSSRRSGDWRGRWSKSRIGGLPTARVDNFTSGNYTLDNILTYKKDFGKHKINFTGLQSAYYQRDEAYFTAVKDLPYNSYWYALNTGTITSQGSSLTERSLLSYMGRVNYAFDDKYLLTLTGRSDGASQLAEGNKWAFFPSLALGWRVSDENFMKNIGFLNSLKLRASYGEVGNSGVNPYTTQATLLNTGYDFDGSPAFGFAPANLANKDLRWERSKELNIGVDFGIFNNRISGSVELYDRNTVDLIMNQKLPTVSGFSQVIANVGEIENRGIEITLNTSNIVSKNFNWNTTITFTKNNNKLLELYGDGQTVDKGNNLFVGHPIRALYDFKFNGIWQLADSTLAKSYKQVPGSVRVVDQNKDNQISSSNAIDDRVILGSQLPNFLLGITNRFNYKNVDLSFFLYYRNGTMYRNSTMAGTFGEVGSRYNSLAQLDYWTIDNPSNTFYSPFVANPYRSAIFYQDASFLRVSDITVGYTLPKKMLDNYKISSARFYAQVMNPFIFTKYIGFDPEFNSAIYQDDVPSATYLIGLNLSF